MPDCLRGGLESSLSGGQYHPPPRPGLPDLKQKLGIKGNINITKKTQSKLNIPATTANFKSLHESNVNVNFFIDLLKESRAGARQV